MNLPGQLRRLPSALSKDIHYRFGEWEKILDEPEPDDYRHVRRAHWRYARALALSNRGRLSQARDELESFERGAAGIPDHWEVSFNNATEVIAIARLMAQGELAYHDGRPAEAFDALREAVKREDALTYAEPPAWMHPGRHALGALLLAEGRAEEADPECAMAHWGVAMTRFQPLWHPTSPEHLERGKVAVNTARTIGAPTPREQGYLAAVAAFSSDPQPPAADRTSDHEVRVRAWKEAQRELHEAFPDDVDAAAFYALAGVEKALAAQASH